MNSAQTSNWNRTMKIDLITNQFVEQFLKGMCTGIEVDSPLFDLEILAQFHSESLVERSLRLFSQLSAITEENYRKYRKDEELGDALPKSKADAQKQIREDFSRSNERLESFSALYHRYYAQIDFSVEELAKTANVVPQQYRRRLNSGLSALTNELRKLEITSNQMTHKSDLHLPLPEYSTLVGVDHLLQKLGDGVASLKNGQILSVEGMGGIGKTALVHAYINQQSISQNYYEVLWVSTRQPVKVLDQPRVKEGKLNFTLDDVTSRLAQQLGLSHLVEKPLEDRLKGIRAVTVMQKYLLVIDNLETIADYVELVPAISRYCGQCKIIITTRESLREFPYVVVFRVPELSHTHASQLVREEVSRRGMAQHISEAELEDLFITVGGLPLALKLVAAQTRLSSVAEIIKEFKSAQGEKESIYRFLYWKIWNSLSEPSRRLLFTFLTADPEGEDSLFLEVLSGLTPAAFTRSFTELDEFSLIESSWTKAILKHRIHRLTSTFLQTDVLKTWELNSNGN